MKLLSLNVWAGVLIDPLTEYLKKQAPTTDVFCFQEVIEGPEGYGDIGAGYRADTYARIKGALPNFVPHYAPAEENISELIVPSPVPVSYGQATLVSPTFEILEHKTIWVTDPKTQVNASNIYIRPRCMQHLAIKTPNGVIAIGNLHGVLDGGSKGDSPDRSRQFKIVADFLEQVHYPKILCGDFNARPETKSLELLDKGMKNLIRDYDIKITRTHWYKGLEKYNDTISDYMFVSPDIKIQRFEVPAITEISDHLPLVLEFSL